MKSRIASVLALVAAFASAEPATAQSLTGTWTLTSEGGRGGTVTQTLTVTQEGSSLTGTMTFTGGGRRGGGGGRGAQPVAISEGSVDGSSFRFTVTLAFQGNSVSQVYAGTVDGDSMSGTIEGPFGERPFTGTRGG